MNKENDGLKSAFLDRDSAYRIAALQCAVERSKAYGGQSLMAVDVMILGEGYYNWLRGVPNSTEAPILEKFMPFKNGENHVLEEEENNKN